MELSIIIISYNTSDLLSSCLRSVYKALLTSKLDNKSEVIVVDNASSDNSVAMVRKNFPKVKLICNKKNLGFATANNQGVRKAYGEYILLLNSDTKAASDALPKLLEIGKKMHIGVVGGKLLNADGTFQPSVGFFPTLTRIFFWMTFLDDIPLFSSMLKPYHIENRDYYNRFQEVDWVSGACMLIKRSIINASGLLDKEIFMYGEDVEWCYRIRNSGNKVCFQPTARIYHYKGASGGGEESGIIEEYSFLKYFYRKHKPYWQYPILLVLLIFGALLRLIIFGIMGKYPKRIALYAKLIKMAR